MDDTELTTLHQTNRRRLINYICNTYNVVILTV